MISLHDPTWQFIITTSTSIVICIITSGINIWLTLKKSKLSIAYQIFVPESVQNAEKIKAIKKRMQIPLDDKTSISPYQFTFKVWNNGKDRVRLPNPTPLECIFRQGVEILDKDDKPECNPDHLQVILNVEKDKRKVRLAIPALEPKQSITVRLVLNDYITDFQAVRTDKDEVKPVKINNLQSARQYKIAGIITACFGIFCMVFLYSFFNGTFADKLYDSVVMGGGYFLLGISLLSTSYFEKRYPPHHNPLLFDRIKSRLKEFLSVLPAVIAASIIGAAIYFFFGDRGIRICAGIFAFIAFPALVWMGSYGLAKWILKKVKVSYTPIVIIIVTGVIPVIILVREIPLFVFVWALL